MAVTSAVSGSTCPQLRRLTYAALVRSDPVFFPRNYILLDVSCQIHEEVGEAGDADDEVAILERYQAQRKAPGQLQNELEERLIKARAIRDRHRAH